MTQAKRSRKIARGGVRMWHALCILRRPNRSRHRWHCSNVPRPQQTFSEHRGSAAAQYGRTGRRDAARARRRDARRRAAHPKRAVDGGGRHGQRGREGRAEAHLGDAWRPSYQLPPVNRASVFSSDVSKSHLRTDVVEHKLSVMSQATAVATAVVLAGDVIMMGLWRYCGRRWRQLRDRVASRVACDMQKRPALMHMVAGRGCKEIAGAAACVRFLADGCAGCWAKTTSI